MCSFRSTPRDRGARPSWQPAARRAGRSGRALRDRDDRDRFARERSRRALGDGAAPAPRRVRARHVAGGVQHTTVANRDGGPHRNGSGADAWLWWSVALAALVAIPVVLRLAPLAAPNAAQAVGLNVLQMVVGICIVVPVVLGPQDRGAIRRVLRSRAGGVPRARELRDLPLALVRAAHRRRLVRLAAVPRQLVGCAGGGVADRRVRGQRELVRAGAAGAAAAHRIAPASHRLAPNARDRTRSTRRSPTLDRPGLDNRTAPRAAPPRR